MRQCALLPTALVLTLFLTACPDILTNHSDGGFHWPAKAKVDSAKALAGELVKVTLSVGFGLDNDSNFSESPHSGFKLGACLIRNSRSQDSSRGGFCGAKNLPLPSWAAMSGGAAADKEFDDFVVRRGETRRFEYTFTFTATEPGRVTIEPVMQYLSKREGYEVPASESGQVATVIFE